MSALIPKISIGTTMCKNCPDKPAVANNMCANCYRVKYHKKFEYAQCAHKDKPAGGKIDGLLVCPACYNKHLKATVPGFAERQRENSREWGRRHPEYSRRRSAATRKQVGYRDRERLRNLERKLRAFGLTIEDAEEVLSKQNGCGICHTLDPGRAWDIDHDHVTGVFRGLLCGRCNKGLGLIGDDLAGVQAALVYLQQPAMPEHRSDRGQ